MHSKKVWFALAFLFVLEFLPIFVKQTNDLESTQ